jgi:succinate-semialdehyde dehydrogenase/glutarate-semialdehyde dehydrogenase
MIQSLNPATGKLLRSFDPLTPEAVESKLQHAATAARTYPQESLDQRIFGMRRLAALLEYDRQELAATMVAEMGKTIVSARAEVDKCIACCRYYAANAARILTPEDIETEHAESYVRYDPLGVILAVMPWNFPLWQVFRFAAPALMAGNVGLLKHASNVPQCALAIEALIRRAGFPRGSFQTLLVEARQVEHLLNDSRVAAVTVTGSEAAGRAIAAQAGWLIKKSVLELGGSDAFIVMPSADLDEAVANAVKARCINNGQSCIASKRFLVHEEIYNDFEVRFVAGMEALRVGDPTLEETDLGPQASAAGIAELARQVAAARAAGGRVLTGGDRTLLESGGFYFQPTVIAGVQRTAPVAREEVFGPVALLFRIGSLEEAIALANDTPFGLSSSCWTNSPTEQKRLAAELQSGSVFFNAPTTSDPRLPFGGIKRSGYGRELSAAGMREFLNLKTVVCAGHRAEQPSLFDPDRVEQRPDVRPALRQEARPEQRSEQKLDRPLGRSSDRTEQPTEFQQLAEQLRRFEPRRPSQEPPVAPSKPGQARVEPPKSGRAEGDWKKPEPTKAEAPRTGQTKPDETEPEDLPPLRGSILGLPR